MQLTTCCGYCSLKTGTIIIGVLQFVYIVFSLIMTFAMDIEWETIGLDRTTAEIISAIYSCITILFCTLLVIGSIKKNRFMMLPWMILNMMIIVVLLVTIVFSLIVFINYDLVPDGLFRSFFLFLVETMIYMYQWLVVYSHFQELKIGSRNCVQERVSTVNRIIIDDEDPARPRERSDPTSAISFI